MLKRLELVGFKSFADKTRFDFAAGITAVVGPNGSGKSNLVDAVRWILGEQSAKSLRGGEMADVIFNGSTTRRSLGLAEVTMSFDNGQKSLATAEQEVQITRRVYRSGEGEYLINQQPCRLRDIKELFLGTGAGSDAYCIIEQGRVDVLLQASTRDRRVIFEEAAGISRFKAKKLETLRKLERVDQNLERLGDIVEEVEKQLRSVKLQAAKAQRHQEYSLRLRELRLALGLAEYHELSVRLDAETATLDGLRAELAGRAAETEAGEQVTRRLEEALARLDEGVHAQEAALASARQHIATEETTLTHEWSVSEDLEKDLTATRARMTGLNAKVASLAEAAARAAGELRDAEGHVQAQRGETLAVEEALAAAAGRLAELQRQIEADKQNHMEQMRQAGRLHNEAVSSKARLDNLRHERERLVHRNELAAGQIASLDVELQGLSRADEELQARLAAARATLAQMTQERDRLRRERDELARSASDLKARRSGLASRVEVLEGLERSHEGLGTGPREVLALLEAATPPWTRELIVGLVADLLTVRREYAPLIDVALGDRAQRFLVWDPGRLAAAVAGRGQPFSGRVGFLMMGVPADAGLSGDPSVSGTQGVPNHPGVVARAAELAACEHPGLEGLPARLLGRTLIVRDLDAARALAAEGCRCITLQGELLECDGTLTVGAHHAETGILSRKSELRELRDQAVDLERQLADGEHKLAGLGDRVAAADTRIETLKGEGEALTEQAADLRSRVARHRQRRGELHEEVDLGQRELSTLERDLGHWEEQWQRAQAQAEAADRQVLALQTRMEGADREVREREHERQQKQQEVTTAKVALGQAEERLKALAAEHAKLERDRVERLRERTQGEQHLGEARRRLEESQRTMLQASAALAEWYLKKEDAERRVTDLIRQRDQARQERQVLAERSKAARAEYEARQEQAHARELEATDQRHRRDTLTDRLREDYQVELAELYAQRLREPAAESAPDAAQANEEIAELRRKLGRLGSVNLDSLTELAELEGRAETLKTQTADLVAAKRSLEEIIATINQDSRRLFMETFTTVRTHFQELFRKLFGGGMADVVLEDESDVLESGVEVIARPPGKELRSISLMSGGEKTLTAVALLLAIFRSKPSPFCILDEVDAALDEANIGRFTLVLREFLDQSQFIIITHSKKTMAVADVLYGVTMQESGVSKQVAVRFEDWVEDKQPAAESAGTRNGHSGAAASGNGADGSHAPAQSAPTDPAA
jgi:chromosome segregation protein